MAAVFTLLVFIFVKYARQEQTIRMGGRAPLNGLYQYVSGSSTRKQTWRNVFVPSLSLKLQSKVVFFNRNEDPRSIFKVEVIDRNGYQETYTSDLAPTPVGYAVYSKHQVLCGMEFGIMKSITVFSSTVCVCVCVCVCIRVCTCMYMCVYIRTYIHVN
jgi:hypothetical protein